MAQNRRTRKLRGGDSRSNTNVERNVAALKKTIEPPEARTDLVKVAESAAAGRWDYQRLRASIKKNIMLVKRANDEVEDANKKIKRIVNEEYLKAGVQWNKAVTRKKGWFY